MSGPGMGYDRKEELEDDVGGEHQRTLDAYDFEADEVELEPVCGCTAKRAAPACDKRFQWHRPDRVRP